MTFGQRLRDFRIKANRSMDDVARAIHVTVLYYSQVEDDKVPAFPHNAIDYEKLASVLNTHAHELMEAAHADPWGLPVADVETLTDADRAFEKQVAARPHAEAERADEISRLQARATLLEDTLRQALQAMEHVRNSPATRLSPLARQDLERGIRCVRGALGVDGTKAEVGG